MRRTVTILTLLAASSALASAATLDPYAAQPPNPNFSIQVTLGNCGNLTGTCVDVSVRLIDAAMGDTGDIEAILFQTDPVVNVIDVVSKTAGVNVAEIQNSNWNFMSPIPGSGHFEIGFDVGQQGGSDMIKSIDFQIIGTSLFLSNFDAAAVRVQSIGPYPDGGGGSAKFFGVLTYNDDGNEVPEPSTFALAGGALLGLSLLRRRK